MARRNGRSPETNDATLSPLWPLVTILGDIAVRVSRRKADEHAVETPETRRGAGCDPVSGGEVAR